MRMRTLAMIVAMGTAGSLAFALPSAKRPSVVLRDAWDRTYDLANTQGRPLLVLYEDKGSANQNDALKSELAQLAKGDAYKNKIGLVAIADVSSYDYWPARGFVKDAIKSESQKQGTNIYCDWKGTVRSAFSFERGLSNVVLYDKDGNIIFVHAGAMSAERRGELVLLLRSLL